ncbi:MAG TPA: virulence factor, partial [Gammaproteobacteria bacterium]|nr:virulence factor [Gammaproteobacteria bacterium]
GREKYKKQLDPKFAIAIDRAAMRAGKGSSEAYMQEWRRETQRLDGDPEELIEILVSQLENEFPDDILEKTIKSSGIKPK